MPGQFLKTNTEGGYYFDPNDSSINAGTVFIIDFDRERTYPTQVAPANNEPIYDLESGAQIATVVKTATNITFTEKGLRFNGTASNYAKFGTGSDHSLVGLGNPDVVFIVHFKPEDLSGYGSYPGLFNRARSHFFTPANFEWSVTTGSDGRTIQFAVSNGTTSVEVHLPAGPIQDAYAALINTCVAVAGAIEDGWLKLYINGDLKATSSTQFTKPYNNYTAVPIQIGEGVSGSVKGIIKRAAMHLLIGELTAAEIVKEDWDSNHERLNS